MPTNNQVFVHDDASFGSRGFYDGVAGFHTIDYSQVLVPGASVFVELARFGVTKNQGTGVAAIDMVFHVANIIGTRNDDTISGDDAANRLAGSDGDDVLDGLGGNDTVQGGDGNDRINGGLGSGQDLLSGGNGDDTFVQSAPGGFDTLDGNAGSDRADYSGIRVGDGQAGGIDASLLAGMVLKYQDGILKGQDSLFSVENITGTTFADKIAGDSAGNALLGGDGNDTLDGCEGSDVLDGGAGVDALDGGDGDDTLAGGAGSDHISGGSGNDVIDQAEQMRSGAVSGSMSNDTIDGGTGIDMADYRGLQATPGATVSIDANLATLTVKKLVAGKIVGSDRLASIENLRGTQGNDVITGDATANVLAGDAGADSIRAGAGDDRIVQDDLEGNDTLDGGANVDTVDFSSAQVSGNDAFGVEVSLASNYAWKLRDQVRIAIDSIVNVENIIGTRANDDINGDSLANVLSGGDGSDRLGGAGGNDTLYGGAGNDALSGDGGNDVIVQMLSASDDTLIGGAGIDTADYGHNDGDGSMIQADLGSQFVRKFIASPGQDQGYALSGIDVLGEIENLVGTGGNDTLTGDQAANSVAGGAGHDVIDGAAGNDTLRGGGGDDTLIGGDGTDVLAGDDGDDRFLADRWAGDNAIDGGQGSDHVDYRAVFRQGSSHAFDIATGRLSKYQDGVLVGVDTLGNVERITAFAAIDITIADASDNVMVGDEGNNGLYGVVGNDTLAGGAGNDTLSGGHGSDVVAGGGGEDVLLQDDPNGNDSLDGGDGIDTVDYRQASGTGNSVDITLSSSYAYKMQDGLIVGTDQYTNIERLIGTRNHDVFRGSSRGDQFSGDAGNDSVSGFDGNDTLNGGAGNDAVSGDKGHDLLVQDTLDGNDTLDGGSGNDVVDYRNAFAAPGKSGAITVNLTTGIVEKRQNGAIAGRDTLVAIESVTGSSYDDTLTGSARSERMNGAAGNDSLSGLDGNDVLEGSDGNDVLSGGSGSNTLDGGLGNDRFVQDNLHGSDYIDGGPGSDTIDYSGIGIAAGNVGGVDVNLNSDFAGFGFIKKYLNGAVLSTDEVSNIDVAIGTRFDDRFSGDATSDHMRGEGGRDTFVQGLSSGEDTLDGGTGIDTVAYTEYFSGDTGVHVDLAAGIALKYHDGAIAGSDRLISIESVIGSLVNDTLSGSKGSDALSAGDGDDLLRQMHWSANDSLDGGAGRDSVDYSAIADDATAILANLGSGKVFKSVSGIASGMDILSNIEAIIGTRANDTITGSVNADRLDGNAGEDSLNGAGGNDTLSGGSGNDVFIEDNFEGSRSIDGGDGTDRIDYSQAVVADARVTVNLAAGTVVKYHGSHVVAIDAISRLEIVAGTKNNDSLIGDEASNLLDGGLGDDTLASGQGDDTLTGAAGNDYLIVDGLAGEKMMDGGAGLDTVDFSRALRAGSSLRFDVARGEVHQFEYGRRVGTDLATNVERVVADTASAPFIVTGATGYLVLGGLGDDVLAQGMLASRDTLDGGAGFDTLDYSSVQAVVGMSGGISVDVEAGLVTKFFNRTYFAQTAVGTDRFSKMEAFVGTGLNDVFKGNAGADVFFGASAGDILDGGAGDDYLDGGSGFDILRGGNGNDTLVGGAGTDFLADEGGSDRFVFDRDFGQDRLANAKIAGSHDFDSVYFNQRAADAIFFQRLGDDLIITVAGTTDKLSMTSWFAVKDSVAGLLHFHVDQFIAGDVVLDSQRIDDFVTTTGAPPVSMLTLLASF